MHVGSTPLPACICALIISLGCSKPASPGESRASEDRSDERAGASPAPTGLRWRDITFADVQRLYRGHNDNAIWFEAPPSQTMTGLEAQFSGILERHGWQRGAREEGLTREDRMVLVEMGDTPENRAAFEDEKVNVELQRGGDEMLLTIEREDAGWKVTCWIHSKAEQERGAGAAPPAAP